VTVSRAGSPESQAKEADSSQEESASLFRAS
jgi:hypothetical protein